MLSLTARSRTPWHRWPALPKLAALALFSLLVFSLDTLAAHLAALGAVVAAYLAGGAGFLAEGLARLRPLLPFVAVLLLWHLATQDLERGALFVLRLVAVMALANLVTMTTRLEEMIALVMGLLRPLRRVGLPTGAVGLAIAMVIRFTPRLMDLTGRIDEAFRARARRRAGWRIAVPLTLAALDDAEQVAEALRARGGVPRED